MVGSTPLETALRRLPAPVAVLGAARDGELGGLTAAWVTRVSENPPLLLVAVGRQRHTWRLLENAKQFTVSLLAEDQVAVARLFGLHSRRDVDKWAQVDHVLLGGGVPALAHCSARFLCDLQDRFSTGDHDCFVGLVAAAETPSDTPPLPLRGADYAP
jgi:flavin reductase (DIM6/NTAB) family NADH-FMN oxidoreductase RutF